MLLLLLIVVSVSHGFIAPGVAPNEYKKCEEVKLLVSIQFVGQVAASSCANMTSWLIVLVFCIGYTAYFVFVNRL